MFRWFAVAILAVNLATSAHWRRRARRASGTIARTREPPALIALRVTLVLPLFGGVLLYMISPASMGWSALVLPSWVRWVGVIIGVVTVPAVYWVFRSIGANISETVLTKDDHVLVMDGPYRWVRHPLYAVGSTLFLSLGLMAANWFLLLGGVAVVIAVLGIVIPREEAALLARFGEAYSTYRRRTGALWPRPRS